MVRKRVTNGEIAAALRELALFLEMEAVPFKPQAYEKAAYAVDALDRPIAEIYADGGTDALIELPAIGRGIATRIAGMLETGGIADLEAMRKATPIDLVALTAIEGIGVKKARALWESLGVRTVADLERAAREGRVAEVAHFGKKSEGRLLEAIAFHQEAAGRRPLGEALAIARGLEQALGKLRGVHEVVIAGSIRRYRETVGDVDILVSAEVPALVSKAFARLPGVLSVLAQGPTKTSVRLARGLDADLRVLSPESFGAALLYFTGSKAHNVALRKLAAKRGLKLNEYGLFRGRRVVAAATEEDIYDALGLPWIPPELREDEGELERALAGHLPALLQPEDIRGDLQLHTSWTDGGASVLAMARAAKRLHREYVVITDHARDLGMTGGLDEGKLRKQIKEVRKVNRELEGIRVLAGAEVNIRADGTLDLADEVLAELDVVGVAIHSHFDQGRAEMTQRIVRALEHPAVDVLFHPLARLLGQRRAVEVDFDAVIEACLATGVVLELDAQPARLDLPSALVRKATGAGVSIAVDSDAHNPDELKFVELFGVGIARRGWAEAASVVNTLPAAALLKRLGRPRQLRK